MGRKDIESQERAPLLPKSFKGGNKFESNIKIPCRTEPNLNAERNGHIVNPGDVVTAHRIVTIVDDEEVEWDHIPIDDMCFVNLGEELGWVMNRNPVTNALILEPVYEENKDSSSAKTKFDMRTFFGTKKYEWATTSVILFNGYFIWQEIDYPTKFPYVWINLVFSFVYCFEIGCKMYAFGPYFWYSNWNVFDFTVTGITIASDFAEYVVPPQTAANMRTLAPVIRLLRLMRLTNMFAGLKSLARSFVTSLGALGWIMVFVAIWFFICACLTTILIGRESFFPDSATKDPKDAQMLRKMFNSVPNSMYALWEVMSMEGWIGVVRPLSRTNPGLVAFFFIFIFVAAFFLMNLVTAVVVDRTVAAQQEGESCGKAVEDDEKEVSIFELIADIKTRNEGQDIIKREFLAALLREPDIEGRLQEFEWEAEMVLNVCAMIDKQRTGEISLEKLQHMVSSSSRPVEMMTMIRMQAELTARLEKQQVILKELAQAS
jgi:voltage-gated sodium channel